MKPRDKAYNCKSKQLNKGLEENYCAKVINFENYRRNKIDEEIEYDALQEIEIYSKDGLVVELNNICVAYGTIMIQIACDNDSDMDIEAWARDIYVNNQLIAQKRFILSANTYEVDFQSIDIKGTEENPLHDIHSIKFKIDLINEENERVFFSENVEIECNILGREIHLKE